MQQHKTGQLYSATTQGSTVIQCNDTKLNSKVFRKVNTDGDKQHLQNDLDKLVKWSKKMTDVIKFGEM